MCPQLKSSGCEYAYACECWVSQTTITGLKILTMNVNFLMMVSVITARS